MCGDIIEPAVPQHGRLQSRRYEWQLKHLKWRHARKLTGRALSEHGEHVGLCQYGGGCKQRGSQRDVPLQAMAGQLDIDELSAFARRGHDQVGEGSECIEIESFIPLGRVPTPQENRESAVEEPTVCEPLAGRSEATECEIDLTAVESLGKINSAAWA